MYTQFNDQTLLFLTIQFSLSLLFALSLNVKQFYLTHRWDPIKCFHSGSEWTWEQWQWRGTLHSLKLQTYWSLTIRLFNVVSRILVGWGSYPSAGMQSVYSTAPVNWAGSYTPMYKLFVLDYKTWHHKGVKKSLRIKLPKKKKQWKYECKMNAIP